MRAKTKIINQSLDNEKSIAFLNDYGFEITEKVKATIKLKKAGRIITITGENMPKELSIKYNEKSTEITLKYDAFVLFDTGDLQEELEKICKGLTENNPG
jgi:hypothetical protein